MNLFELFGLSLLISFTIGMVMSYVGTSGKRELSFTLVILVVSLMVSGLIVIISLFLATAAMYVIWTVVGASMVWFGVMGAALSLSDREGWAGLGKIVTMIVVLAVLLVGIGGWGGLGTASHYNTELKVTSGSSLFANDTLPYDEIPIVSEQYASYIATSHLSDFGGNVMITDNEMIVYNGSPYWIFSIAPTNVFAVNHLVGFVLVNAVDANYTDIFQKSYFGNGLWFLSNINVHAYLGNTQYSMGNHYPQPAPNGQVDYVVTYDSYSANGVMSLAGGAAFSPTGQEVVHWTNISNAPTWINQPWDKSLLDSIISTWASSRTGNNSFGFFAGGLFSIKASPWMMSVDNISELIPYHGRAAYMQFLSPASNPNGLGGVMLATGGTIYFYNMEGMSMISATAAKATIQAKLPALSGATYFTANPILYPVGKYYAWIVPYYSEESTTNIVQLQGVGIVDAENSAHYVNIQSQFASISSTGVEKLMSNAVESFLKSNVVQNTTNYTKISGIITHEYQFDQNGSTIVAIQLNNSSWYFAGASYLNNTEMVSVLSLSVNETVGFEVIGDQIYEVVPVA